ncbi:hypothetical protein V6N11_048052 [Hibiscus sabdariffa]|uniref:Transmembrane protein n=1 Tax=Hibiscus sabdariffa TaxID=183260 RepID=A0ABR1ZJG2_9ROSI
MWDPRNNLRAEEEDGDGDGDGDRDLVLGEEKPSPVPSLPSSRFVSKFAFLSVFLVFPASFVFLMVLENVECKRSNLYRMKDMIIEIFMWRDAAKINLWFGCSCREGDGGARVD